MQSAAEHELTGRDRRRLERARARGYLDARCRLNRRLTASYSFWCWKLRIPVVWLERLSPRSGFGRVRLDMFTTPNLLTEQAQNELKGLDPLLQWRGRAAVSSHDGCWDRVPLDRLDELAARVFKIATRPGNYDLMDSARPGTLPRRIAAAQNVLSWKIPA
jgi:hypothetical protein